MKLTQTDVVFSKTCFLCINKSSWNGMKLCEDFLYNKRVFLEPRATRGGTWVGTTNQGAHAPPPHACSGGLSPHGGLADPETYAIKSYFSRKNQGERIIAIHETEPPPPPVLHREARSGVRLGLRRGGSSFFVITNPSPSPIP